MTDRDEECRRDINNQDLTQGKDHVEDSNKEKPKATIDSTKRSSENSTCDEAMITDDDFELLLRGHPFLRSMGSFTQKAIDEMKAKFRGTFWEDFQHETSSHWEEGVAIIESILMSESNVGLSENQKEGLMNVQQLLISGMTAKDVHVPRQLLSSLPEPGSTSDFILSAYGGVRMTNVKKRVLKVMNAQRFLHRLQLQSSSSKRLSQFPTAAYLLPEWSLLKRQEQIELTRLLSWDNLQSWNFDIFEIDKLTHGQPLLYVAWAVLASPCSQLIMEHSIGIGEGNERNKRQSNTSMLERPGYGFIETFKISQIKLVNFLREIEMHYLSENPYHNNIHAADVVQTLHAMLQGMKVKELANAEIELLALLLAAVVHDVGHPGRSNAFQVNTHSDLALTYNDVSVLENMHISIAFQLLQGSHKRPDLDIFDEMTATQTSAIRKMMIECVLSTDMTHHFAFVNRIKGIRLTCNMSYSRTSKIEGDEIEYTNNDTWELLHFALHLADISNAAKQIEVCKQWTDRVLAEFFLQGDEEKKLGIPVTPLCDRMTTSRADSQIGFIKFVVKPAYEAYGRLIPDIQERVIPILEANLEYWKEEHERDISQTIGGN